MVKMFRREQCPTCRFNLLNYSCGNAYDYTIVTALDGVKHYSRGMSRFKGETKRTCKRYEEKTED